MSLYLIKRGPQPSYQKQPFHPIIVCDRKHVAQWEAQGTINGATVWEALEAGSRGWLITRWNGLLIDYKFSMVKFNLPDGTPASIWRDSATYKSDEPKLHDLLAGAVWWSDRLMPDRVVELGVIYPRDSFTQQRILDLIADDGSSGSGNRVMPACWCDPIGDKNERHDLLELVKRGAIIWMPKGYTSARGTLLARTAQIILADMKARGEIRHDRANGYNERYVKLRLPAKLS